MPKDACLFLRSSVPCLILLAMASCDPGRPQPNASGSTSAVVDAAVDRVLLGVGGAPVCNSAHPPSDTPTSGNDGGVGAGGAPGVDAGAGGEPDGAVDARAVDAGKIDAGGGGTTASGGTSGGPGGAGVGGARGGAPGATGGTGAGGLGAGGLGGDGRGDGRGGGGAAGQAGGAGHASAGGASGAGGALTGAAGGGGGSVPGAPAPQHGDLAIVELLINPASTDTGREWIELVNRTSHALDLSTLHIADAANDAPVDFGALSPVLGAGARAVLIQSADVAKNGGVSLTTTWGGSFGTRVSLNNDTDTITVCVGPCATGVVVDQVTWDATLQGDYDGHALVIDDAGHRCPASASFGDAGSFGTPGAQNPACP
ncbi:MAG TPA: lamin tail domain-containing protein [Polyangia bacterium]|jgi:hypothetical protein|nr:lamin tail domain-containing protein [Polyangia bacterium]